MFSFKQKTCLASLIATVPAVLHAQDVLEVITVTAERREESLQTVPIAVTALTAADLQNRQIDSPQDLARVSPSLKMTANITSPTNLSPGLRGSTAQDASSIAAESPFGIYIDDIYIGRMNGNNVQFGDLESIEVLRGPQGTLYGRNTLSGALKFTTRTPGAESWLNAELGAGNADQLRAGFSVGGPLSDTWGASLSAIYNTKDGQWRNVATNKDVGLNENIAARAKVHYMPGNGFDAVAFVSYVDSKNDATQLVPGTTPGRAANQTFTSDDIVPTLGYYRIGTPSLTEPMPLMKPNSVGETTQTIAGLTMSYDFGDATLRSISGYVGTEDYYTNDMNGLGFVRGASDVDADQFTQELHIHGSALSGTLQYIVGVYYLNETATQDWAWYYFGPASTSVVDIETESISVFGQLEYEITDSLSATLGARWTQDDKSFDASMVQLAPFGGFTSPVALENTYSEWTPKAGLDYVVPVGGSIDSMLLYTSAAKGFKSGGYNGINITDLSGARSAYGPESNWTYEVGMKAEFFSQRLRVNAAYFYEKAEDLALNATVFVDGIPAFPVQNVGDATIEGLELEITAIPTNGLTLFLNPSFLSGRYTKLDPSAAPAAALGLYGVSKPRVPQIPWVTFSAGFDYQRDLPLGERNARLLVGMDYFRSAEYVVTPTNDFTVSPYDRTNGYIGLEFADNWEVRLTGRNLQDRRDINTGSRDLGGFFTLPPREWLLSLRYRM
ncbi:MAG TPA: TonB-dependent receptor [Steroidobacter sp.]|uniref:TonB-dependent receptor n=1 Tax=Steroidobacter sp. TaxID=1978227 RepID=UPI002EDAE61B